MRVQGVHRLLEPPLHDVGDVRLGARDRGVNQLLLRRRRPAQNIRHNLVGRAGMADADAQAHVVRRAELLGYIGEAVVAAVAAADLEPHRPRRQVEIVVRHQHPPGRYLVIPGERGDRVAAVVKEGGGPQQPNLRARDGAPADVGAEARLVLEPRVRAGKQRLQKTEPGVVPGFRILRARVAQADDQGDYLVHSDGANQVYLPSFLGASAFLASPLAAASGFLAPSAFLASPSAAAGAAAAAAAASPSAGTATTGATSSTTFIGVMPATARLSPPCARLVITTPSGSLISERCTDWLRCRPERSASRNSGRSFGRQVTSNGTFIWSFSVALMRCRSTCMICGLYGCICQSRRIAWSFSPPTLTVRIAVWK